jgi:YbgC/YbaW family acyl-CoA thioester hydrolase
MFSIQVEVPPELIAPVYDHVHHGQAFTFFEAARVALMEHLGVPYQGYLDQGLGLVIGSVQASYKRELKGGSVTVTCDRLELRGRSIIINQRILNSKGKVAVEAVVESIFMDIQARRGVSPPQDFLEAVKRFPKG